MSKITAVVNIYEGGCSFVLFAKTSRFAFYAFRQDDRCFDIKDDKLLLVVLKQFYALLSSYKARKILLFSQLENKLALKIKNIIKKHLKIDIKNLSNDEIFDIKSRYLKIKLLLNNIDDIDNINMCEAYYIYNLLKRVGKVFPNNYYPSIRSLEDRFLVNKKITINNRLLSNRLFDEMYKNSKIDIKLKPILATIQRLISIYTESNITNSIDEFIKNNLKLGFTKEDILLILDIINNNNFKDEKMQMAKFIVDFVVVLNRYNQNTKSQFRYENEILFVKNSTDTDISFIKTPNSIKKIIYENSNS